VSGGRERRPAAYLAERAEKKRTGRLDLDKRERGKRDRGGFLDFMIFLLKSTHIKQKPCNRI
jgi:hypothetical protein